MAMRGDPKKSFILSDKWAIWWLAVGSILVISSRWLYRSQYLFHWDSVQFALALDRMDIMSHRPHPPGYVVYIWLGRLFHWLGLGANDALIAVGILFTVLGLWGIFYFTRQVFGRPAAYLASALFLVNSTVWFHGLVAEVYIVEAVAALLVVWMLYRLWRQPTLINILIVAVGLGLLGGFRQTAEVALLPLVIYVIWLIKPSRRWLWQGAGVLLLSNLVWLMPVLINTGGLQHYLQAIYQLSKVVIIAPYRVHGVWGQWVANLQLQFQALYWVIVVELVVLFLGASPFLMRGRGKRYPVNWREVGFWAIAWLGPFLLVTFTVMTNPGYMLLNIILLLPLVAASIMMMAKGLSQHHKMLGRWWLIVAGGGLLGYQLFNFYALRPDVFEFINPSLPSIQRHDQRLTDIISAIRSNSQPGQVAVWVSSAQTIIFFGIRHMQYYMPDVDIYRGTPQSLVHRDEDAIWHVRGDKVDEFVKNADIAPSITTLFTIRDTWSELHKEFEIPVELPSGHFLVYYDLTDPDTRQNLTRYGFTFNQWIE